jgi:DNA repair exonuclease SbcCD ATPase subunit
MHKSLQDRYNAVCNNYSKADILRTSAIKRRDSAIESKKSHEYKAQLNARCAELFKHLLEKSIDDNVNSISDLVTSGLNSIIEDQDLRFKINQEHKNNRIAMKFILEQDGNSGDPLNSFGGGAAVVISLILRLAVMKRIGKANLLLLDESMVALANAYVPNAAQFMRELSEKTGVNILMVTHNPEFIQNAHCAYEVTKSDHLEIRRVSQ